MDSRLDAGEMQEMEQVQAAVPDSADSESAIAVPENAEVRRGSNGQFLPGQSDAAGIFLFRLFLEKIFEY